MNNRNFFLKYLQGEWLLQKNLFLFKQKEQKNSEKNVCFNKILYSNKFFNTKNKINYDISSSPSDPVKDFPMDTELSKNLNIYYHKKCFFYSKYLLKNLLIIVKIHYSNKFIQYEYIYLVNRSLMINISLLKNFKGRYLGTKVSSYIKRKGSA